MKSQSHESEEKTKNRRPFYLHYNSQQVTGGEQEISQVLTCHVQEERCGLGAQAVLASSCHPVDPHRLVDVLDPVLDGAHVGVGEGVAVAEVQRDARPRAVALRGTITSYFLTES